MIIKKIFSMVAKPRIGSIKDNSAIFGRHVLSINVMEYLRGLIQKRQDYSDVQISSVAMQNILIHKDEFRSIKVSSKRDYCGSPIGLRESSIPIVLKNDGSYKVQIEDIINSMFEANEQE